MFVLIFYCDKINSFWSKDNFNFCKLTFSSFLPLCSTLREISFEEANLRNASLFGAGLIDVNFKNADLTGVNMAEAAIGGANFDGANLEVALYEQEI